VEDLLKRALEEQERKLQELDQRLVDLRALQQQRDKIYALVCQMRANLDMPPYGVTQPPPEPINLAVNDSLQFSDGEPLWVAAKLVLERAQQSMTLQEIVSELIGLGYKVSGRTGLETVRAALTRKPQLFGKERNAYFLRGGARKN
jgi:hypothetical protein